MAKQVSLPEEGAVDRQEGKSQGMARNGGGILLKTRSSTSGWVLLLALVRVGFSWATVDILERLTGKNLGQII